MVLGTNGLGKTTLVTMIFRLLTGPFDIRGQVHGDMLGTTNLDPVYVPSIRNLFRQRVMDNAISGIARLQFRLGDRHILIERSLRDVSLRRFLVDDQVLPTDERSFQEEIARRAGVWSFGDWILMLRYIVFYFEDRQALVWDFDAQRQVLRFLLLPPEVAQQWTQDERAILKLDSEMRNLRNAVGRQERQTTVAQQLMEKGTDIAAELTSLESLQEVDEERRADLDNQLVEAEAARREAFLVKLQSEQERESRYRAVERAKLTAIEARFPERSETARYILSQLMVEAECLVCGNKVPDAARNLEQRLEKKECVLCGFDLSLDSTGVAPTALADRRFRRLNADLEAIELQLEAAQRQLEETERNYQRLRIVRPDGQILWRQKLGAR
jgi:hypothetical protein